MEFKIFSIYDCKTEAYVLPLFFVTKGAAIRSFTDAVSGSDPVLTAHAEDYTLFELGHWSDANAKFVLHDAPIAIGSGIS